jgi:hypothetical protein
MKVRRCFSVFIVCGLFIGIVIIPSINIKSSVFTGAKENINSIQNDFFDLLVISPSEFNDALLPLIEHKNYHGIKTRIINLEQIQIDNCRDKQEEIKYFIKESIENHNISYVLLVGDRERIPVRMSYTTGDITIDPVDPFISDLYYADIYDKNGDFCSWDSNNNSKFGEINGDEMIDKLDLKPDVYIGRLLCSNVSEVSIVVEKIIHYEDNAFGKDWFNNIILCGGDTFGGLLLFLFNLIYHNNGGFEGEIVCDEVKGIMNDFNPITLYASALLFPMINKIVNQKSIPSAKNINKAINNGAGFVLFSGHGTYDSWITYPPIFSILNYITSYQSIYINELVNKDKLPIVVMHACSCGDFSETTGTSSPIAWEFIKKQDGGAIASIASTSLTKVGTNEPVKDVTSGYFTTLLFKETTMETVGEMLAEAQIKYLNSFSSYNGDDYLTVEQYVLFGDPSLKIGGYS